MIKDTIEHAKNYYGISKNLEEGFQWIKSSDLENMSEGRYEISDSIYANVQSYLTKDDAPYEAHKKYIDIQYMIQGSELIAVTDYKNCIIDKSYDENKDIEFLNLNGVEDKHILRQGEFCVFFPNDAHKPALDNGTKKNVKKVIVKVRG